MSDSFDSEQPDLELQHLASQLVDGRLDPGQRERLEQRIRTEPDAKAYCVKVLRFEALIRETAEPRTMEWEEIRRINFDRRGGDQSWAVQSWHTFRYGVKSAGILKPLAKKRRWFFGAALAAVAAGGAAYLISRPRMEPVSLTLRNGDFEAMDLSQSPRAIVLSLFGWQDYFSCDGSQLCEIGRFSKGRIFAKSGRNVARLNNQAFLTQRLIDSAGNGLKAAPGMKVVISGWSYAEAEPPYALSGSLRFVASGYPDMIQYEAAGARVFLDQGGWHAWRMEIVLPDSLVRAPSDLVGMTNNPPAIDLNGKELTLSLDNHSAHGILLLDDLKIEIFAPP